jgi:predicted Zn-dependent peptidase
MGLVAGASITAGWATARPGVDLEKLETAFWEELDRIGREPPTDDELARAKALIEADELGALQSVHEKADRLSMYATLFGKPEMINDILPRYLSTTAEEIRAVCADVFSPDNRVVITYVPAGAEAATDAAAGAAA